MTLRLSRDGTIGPVSMTAMSADPNSLPPRQTPIKSQPSAEATDTTPPIRQHSRSMPSTPSQRPHPDGNAPRSPSLHRTLHNISPRSLQSDASQAPYRKPCKYETAMAKARRRVPYSLGPDKLIADPAVKDKNLSLEQEENLSKDMRELYNRLIPTPESEARREKFIAKLERLLCERWPQSSIKVNVFGSTGNCLGTLTSDVDICITTDNKELTRVCSIAELLANKGMERVVCVSSAKVPIVKLWDPELQVACDLNVNNPIALENTALVRSYVAIDDRVRPLAMIIKHWAKRRILNDAALGMTLSSYTWICLTVNFLQTLKPPVLPSLQTQPRLQPHPLDGVNVAFEKDVSKFTGFGSPNTASLGRLLYEFFRFYAHEFDFEACVVSVRLGSHVAKSSKGWHMLQGNRLCVEEPFNINRNLANTADDTTMRGIHLELRRAFDLIVEGKLDVCCEQFVYPTDEVKPSDIFVPPQSRPIITQPPPSQLPRSGKANRNGKNGTHTKNNVASRRSSNPIHRQQMYLRNLPFPMTPQELQSQAMHQQHLLHDQLFQQYQYLQMQEQELRARLNQQNRHILAQQRGLYGNQDDHYDSATAAAFQAQSRGPLSAPLYQSRFNAPSPFLPQQMPANGIVTNPSSPHLPSAMPDTRRIPRRTTVGYPFAGGSLRAQSQPARGLVSSMSMTHLQPAMIVQDHSSSRRSSASGTTHESGPPHGSHQSHSHNEPHRKPSEYVGYFVGQSPSLYGYPQSASISPMPSHAGLAIQNGGLSPRLYSRSSRASASGTTSTSPVREPDVETPTRLPEKTMSQHIGQRVAEAETPSRTSGPLIVDGSIYSPRRRTTKDSVQADSEEPMTFSGSTSDDFGFDTPSSSEDNSHEIDETTVKSRQVKTNGHVANHFSTTAERIAPTTSAYSLSAHLPSVQEVRTPSPSFGLMSPVINGGFVPGAQIPERGSPLAHREAADVGLAIRTNGTSKVINNQVPNISSWQTPKKKHQKKKTVKSENDALVMNAAGGELLPLDGTQQKGG